MVLGISPNSMDRYLRTNRAGSAFMVDVDQLDRRNGNGNCEQVGHLAPTEEVSERKRQ
jgi:hypothetical protein